MVVKLVVDTLGERRGLAGPIALLAGLAVGGALLNAAGTYLLGRTAESVVLTARERLVSRLLRLPLAAVDHLKPGDLLSRVTTDTTLLRSVSTYGLVDSVNAVFLLVGSVVLMATLDAVLLLVTLAVLALNAVAVLLVVPRIRRATERSQAAVGGMGSVLERALGGFRTVKAHGAEEGEIASLGAAARRAWRRGVEVAGWSALMEASAGLAVQLSFLAVLGVGGLRVATGVIRCPPWSPSCCTCSPDRPGRPARQRRHPAPGRARRRGPHPGGRAATGRAPDDAGLAPVHVRSGPAARDVRGGRVPLPRN